MAAVDVTAELVEARAAFDRASTAIALSPDTVQGFQEATTISALAKELDNITAVLRGHLITRLADTTQMSGTDLSALFGISRSRVAQLLAIGRSVDLGDIAKLTGAPGPRTVTRARSKSSGRRRERLAGIQGGICPACELPLPEDLTEVEVDHVIPRCRGGPDLEWNRQLLHLRCNRRKWANLTAAATALAAERGVILREWTKRA